MNSYKAVLTLENVRDHIDYIPATGELVWKKPTSRRVRVGSRIGTPSKEGYLICSFLKYRTSVHRLIWFFHNGEWPNGEIDHLDMNRTNNRIENLRVVNRSDNVSHSGRRIDNVSGLKGVSWNSARKHWVMQIQRGSQKIWSRFFSAQEAYANYVKWAAYLDGNFLRVRHAR